MRVGIDIGTTTTKVAGLDARGPFGCHTFAANDRPTSAAAALEEFLQRNALARSELTAVGLTGIRARECGQTLQGLPCQRVQEFQAIGRGGLHVSGLTQAIVVSMGTGTAVVRAAPDGCLHLGGTGVGGGTLLGLAECLLGTRDIRAIVELADEGNLARVDLTVGDLAPQGPASLPGGLTASNLGRLSGQATRADYALGILNLVFQTVGVVSLFAAARFHEQNVVLTGMLTAVPQAAKIFAGFGLITPVRFVVPPHAQYATAVGAALSA